MVQNPLVQATEDDLDEEPKEHYEMRQNFWAALTKGLDSNIK
jgi:hypothetical protein